MFVTRSVTHAVEVSCAEAGEIFASGEDGEQREFLLAWANTVEQMGYGNWAMQCRAIVDGAVPHTGLSQADRIRLKVILSTLVEHLGELE